MSRFCGKTGGATSWGRPRGCCSKFEQELLAKDWREVHEGLEVRLCPAPGGKEVFILCRSARAAAKEQAMHEVRAAHRRGA